MYQSRYYSYNFSRYLIRCKLINITVILNQIFIVSVYLHQKNVYVYNQRLNVFNTITWSSIIKKILQFEPNRNSSNTIMNLMELVKDIRSEASCRIGSNQRIE
jgi:hypothetical protein